MQYFPTILRPAGNSISLKLSEYSSDLFKPLQIHFYHSGTQHDTDCPEVLLPAYSCPDLISACVHSGAKPVLIDFIHQRPWMCLEQLERAITPDTIAVVAVRFLGISERTESIRNICDTHNLTFIEDSAQGFPLSDLSEYWQGDFNIISFGRGKPLSLLGGGAVLTRNSDNYLPLPDKKSITINEELKYRLKVGIYNLSIHPFLYGLITRIPGLNIGKTILKELTTIEDISASIKNRFMANYIQYQSIANKSSQINLMLQETNNDTIIDLAEVANHDFNQPLLRYPVLFSNLLERDNAYNKLFKYGASLMYKQPLMEIDGVSKYLKKTTEHPVNAKIFSDRLLTLPTHTAVTQEIIDKIHSAIE